MCLNLKKLEDVQFNQRFHLISVRFYLKLLVISAFLNKNENKELWTKCILTAR